MIDLELSDELYRQFRDLVLTRCGLSYPERKRDDLAHGLRLALRSSGLRSLEALYAEALRGGPTWDLVVQHLTIGETHFFRNTPQFNALRQHIIPEIRMRCAQEHRRGLRVWSAGCATGEEPYSLAMLFTDLLTQEEREHTHILATDLNPQFLARAREGLYGEWSFRETPKIWRERFFRPEGRRWRLQPEIRQMVRFAYLNLTETGYPAIANGTYGLDLILCRNVTIYFDASTTRQVIERFYGALAPGGWLIVGHAEPQANVYRQFEIHNFPGTVVYRKPLPAPLFPVDERRSFRAAETVAVPSSSRSARTSEPARMPSHAPTSHTQVGRSDPESQASAELIQMARVCADRGDWHAAEEYCTAALQQDPLSIAAHYVLAQMHEQQGELETALAAYRRTVYLDRDFLLGTIGMANIWRQMGQVTAAQRSYRNVLKHLLRLPPTSPVPLGDGMTNGDLATLVAGHLQALA